MMMVVVVAVVAVTMLIMKMNNSGSMQRKGPASMLEAIGKQFTVPKVGTITVSKELTTL